MRWHITCLLQQKHTSKPKEPSLWFALASLPRPSVATRCAISLRSFPHGSRNYSAYRSTKILPSATRSIVSARCSPLGQSHQRNATLSCSTILLRPVPRWSRCASCWCHSAITSCFLPGLTINCRIHWCFIFLRFVIGLKRMGLKCLPNIPKRKLVLI